MIRYSLACADGHRFESWFQSASAYDRLRAAGHVSCAICAGTQIEKAPMAPRLSSGTSADRAVTVCDQPLAAPATELEARIDTLRKKVEASSTYVGSAFAREARAMHDGDAPARPIYGEARAEDARALMEDGVPVLPLPFRARQKSN